MSKPPYNKIIDVVDFEDSHLIPYLHEIAYDEMVRFGLSAPVILPDSKQWECAMMLRTFTECGTIQPRAVFVGIGAGTEQTTFALAAKGCIVYPVDRYLETTPWSDVAPAGMMVRPSQYTNFQYPRGSVIPVHSDARALRLPDEFSDGVYSAGSIEHFGSLEAVAAAAEEIGRVLKPGGVASISTEFRLDGPNGQRWFDDNCILFTPELLDEYIVKPSGLELIGEKKFETSSGTFDGRTVLLDFLEKVKRIDSIGRKRNAYPNLVLYHKGFLFCSVHLALRKPLERRVMPSHAQSARFESIVQSEATRASGVLTSQIQEWTSGYGQGFDAVSQSTYSQVGALEAELAALRNSRSFRATKPLRAIASYVRSKPVLRKMVRKTLGLVRRLRQQPS
jgi:SAM-dependent methyltransferase